MFQLATRCGTRVCNPLPCFTSVCGSRIFLYSPQERSNYESVLPLDDLIYRVCVRFLVEESHWVLCVEHVSLLTLSHSIRNLFLVKAT